MAIALAYGLAVAFGALAGLAVAMLRSERRRADRAAEEQVRRTLDRTMARSAAARRGWETRRQFGPRPAVDVEALVGAAEGGEA